MGSDVYAAGFEHNGSNVYATKNWKTGQAMALTDGTKEANANSIVVADSDAHVEGAESNGAFVVAKYWNNGQEVPLTSGSEAFRGSITVVDSDVYVAGTEVNNFISTAKYWKNGQPIQLSNQGLASAIVVVKREKSLQYVIN